MAEELDDVESGEEEAEAPKRKRRAPAKKKAAAKGGAAPKKAAPKKRSSGGGGRSTGCVTLDGNTITCEGKGVRVRYFDAKQHGLLGIEGPFETPCTTPVRLKFRSEAAATKFFKDSMFAEDPNDMLIAANDSVDWDSDIIGG